MQSLTASSATNGGSGSWCEASTDALPRPAAHGVRVCAGPGAPWWSCGERQFCGEQPGAEWQCCEDLPQLIADKRFYSVA